MKGRSSGGHSDSVSRFPRIPVTEPLEFTEFDETSRMANAMDAK